MAAAAVVRLPPGFRFRPTDEELVQHYLMRKALRRPLPVSVIPDVDLPRYDPWDIPGGGAVFAEKERYVFARREEKSRRTRAAGSGYWEATGRELEVAAAGRVVGVRRTLVFRRGRPSRGPRTGWVMHEYRLADTAIPEIDQGWVLCHVFLNGMPAASGPRCARSYDGDNSVDAGNSSDSEPSCVTEISDDDGSASEVESGNN